MARDAFMPDIHFMQPGFTYSACEPFTIKRKKPKKKKWDSKYIYQKHNPDKDWFQHELARRI